ncbi:uncharacterized protein FOMMEDRAFT_158999 [Fomitiporia mediterranea MF3/22]|uniref:uncharacterized protein n=1 Tax=Fomitiporia mediterranea (strain MF3/22) TaxID=694068 RepID=UPI00044086C7|nr:uncharacterized protein FOMMEDRAFT_158999 [Fomitiporia mediterranea MF3/22]EJD00327.1 hypothetical protein FOMMEDRAFT_158999 [Fomitiporia mediterranea MF3/22]
MLQARMDGRVNIIERSRTGSSDNYLFSTRSDHTSDIERSGGIFVAIDKQVTSKPECVTQHTMRTSPSLATYCEDREHSSIELSDSRKGASIV